MVELNIIPNYIFYSYIYYISYTACSKNVSHFDHPSNNIEKLQIMKLIVHKIRQCTVFVLLQHLFLMMYGTVVVLNKAEQSG